MILAPRQSAYADASGEMILTYDAWNRLVGVDDDGDPLDDEGDAAYTYDGLGRRITVERVNNSYALETVRSFFNDNWQVVEERAGSSTNAKSSYVWDIRYVDAMIARDFDTNNDGQLDQQLFPTHDANFNITAVVNPSGVAVERYTFDPYGYRHNLDGAWVAFANNQPPGTSPNFTHGHQGGQYDPETGLMLFRHRYLHPTLMRWMSRDPLGYVDGGSLYEGYRGMVTNASDPEGLQMLPLNALWTPWKPVSGTRTKWGWEQFELSERVPARDLNPNDWWFGRRRTTTRSEFEVLVRQQWRLELGVAGRGVTRETDGSATVIPAVLSGGGTLRYEFPTHELMKEMRRTARQVIGISCRKGVVAIAECRKECWSLRLVGSDFLDQQSTRYLRGEWAYGTIIPDELSGGFACRTDPNFVPAELPTGGGCLQGRG